MLKFLKILFLIGNLIFLFFAILTGYDVLYPVHSRSIDIGFDIFGSLVVIFVLLGIPLLNITVLFIHTEIQNKILKTTLKWSIMVANIILIICLLSVFAYRLSPFTESDFIYFPLHNYILEIIAVFLMTTVSLLVLLNRLKSVKTFYISIIMLFVIFNLFDVKRFLDLSEEQLRFHSIYQLFYISAFFTSVLGIMLFAMQGVRNLIRLNKHS